LHIRGTNLQRLTVPNTDSCASDLATTLSLLLETHDRRTLRAELLDSSAQTCFPGNSGRQRLSKRRIAQRKRLLTAAGISALALGEADFPDLLSVIPDPPLVLYHRGDITCLTGTAVAIVGARRATQAGQAFARSLAAALADAGAVIVSGLALGVDAAAHRGALEAGGRTIAVLGSGAEFITPVANAPLGEKVLAGGGLILSEYPPGTRAAPFRFPERNRLISGLSRGVVVVEAAARSGSLITARLAAEQGREVMAVPGAPGYPNSTGCNGLLKAGAALIERAEDVLHAIGSDLGSGPVAGDPGQTPPGLSPEQQGLLDLLDARAQGLAELAAAAGLGEQACAVSLTELELGGFVQRVGGGYIRRPSEF
jgi:DNA processing protein